jgi:hypothetical protein
LIIITFGGNYDDDGYDDEAINSSCYLNGILYTMTLYQDQYRMIADNDLMIADGDGDDDVFLFHVS